MRSVVQCIDLKERFLRLVQLHFETHDGQGTRTITVSTSDQGCHPLLHQTEMNSHVHTWQNRQHNEQITGKVVLTHRNWPSSCLSNIRGREREFIFAGLQPLKKRERLAWFLLDLYVVDFASVPLPRLFVSFDCTHIWERVIILVFSPTFLLLIACSWLKFVAQMISSYFFSLCQ